MRICDICKRPELNKGNQVKIAIRPVAYRLLNVNDSSVNGTLDQETKDMCDDCIKKVKRAMREAFDNLTNPPEPKKS